MGETSIINTEDLKRFLQIRREMFKQIKESLEIDGHCKSYEGSLSIEIHFPDYWEGDIPHYNIHLDCYLLGPHRHYDFPGMTLAEALDRLELAVTKNDWTQEGYEKTKWL